MSNHCSKCTLRIPKTHPLLKCSLCNCFLHYRCNSLSKREACIISQYELQHWMCTQCIKSILPINACHPNNNSRKITASDNAKNKSTFTCTVCNKLCSNKHTAKCTWCNLHTHVKCSNKLLGCKACCENIIPGFHYTNRELMNHPFKNNIVFNPYDQQHLVNQLGENFDEISNNEHWSNISDKLIKCKYTELKNVKPYTNNDFKIMSLNIRSLAKNIDHVRAYIDQYQKFDALFFNETNLNPDKLPNGTSDLLLDGFHPPILKAPNRTSSRGGGLAIYVNTKTCELEDFNIMNISSTANNDVSRNSASCEYLFVRLNIKNEHNLSKSFIIGNFYRSPSLKPNDYIEDLNQILKNLGRHKSKHILLVGDLNIDLIKYNTDNNSQNLINTTTNHGFIQTISRPTRITDHSATLIDHIYTNQIHDIASTGILTLDISDHLGTYISIPTHKRMPDIHDDQDLPVYSQINTENLSQFKEYIKNETWSEVMAESNTQTRYDKFIETYTKHYDNAFPKKAQSSSRRKIQRKNPKAWILPWLESACDRKNRAYKNFVKNPTINNKVKYNNLKKCVQKHINIAKQKYYKKYFEQYNTDSRKQWQMLNSLLNRNSKKTETIKLHDENGNIISSPTLVAEKFNDYFCNIATKLKSEIRNPTNSQNFVQFLKNPVAHSIYLTPTHSYEIRQTIMSLKLKATSDTKINALKTASEVPKFNSIMSDLVNVSFEQGIFPSQLKTAKVIPVHKGGSKTNASNYRPISLLSSFSKIFEKVMHSRLTNFLESNKSLHETQYGFRSGRSCEHALLMAQNELLNCMSKKKIALLLLIDFSKAFDMVDHVILLRKLQHYGIRGNAHSWLTSYLSHRNQCVSVGGKNSTSNFLKHGVPQGSILGPLLFIIYINDIPQIGQLAKFILYADDANIIITGDNMADIE